MNGQRIRTAALQIRLASTRLGGGVTTAWIFCLVGAASWLWGIPELRARSQAQEYAVKNALQALRSADSAQTVRRPATEARLAGFYNTLGEQRFAEQQIKSLFAIAQKTGLSLTRAEYKSSFDKNGGFHTYQILLPVKGSYGSIRQFLEQTLLTIPFASLDELSFKRDGIGNSTLEAKLRFTLYLNDTTAVPNEREDVPVRDAGT